MLSQPDISGAEHLVSVWNILVSWHFYMDCVTGALRRGREEPPMCWLHARFLTELSSPWDRPCRRGIVTPSPLPCPYHTERLSNLPTVAQQRSDLVRTQTLGISNPSSCTFLPRPVRDGLGWWSSEQTGVLRPAHTFHRSGHVLFT